MSDLQLFPEPESADTEARGRIATALDETLFVEAGAGSGKTTALVGRVVNLVLAGTPIEEIAAITFTEKAAAELRDRVRARLDDLARNGDAVGQARAQQALDDLDAAAISTLHSFAQRILGEHPIEAGLPPAIEVLDEISSDVAFEQRWDAFLDDLLDERAHWPTLLKGFGAGLDTNALRDIAIAFNNNWDLVAEQVDPDTPDAPEPDLSTLFATADKIFAARRECADHDDTLAAVIDGEIAAYLEQLRRAEDADEVLSLLTAKKPTLKVGRKGRKDNWSSVGVTEVRDLIVELAAERAEVVRIVGVAALERLAVEVARFTLEGARERRAEGALEFHDLLVLSRAALRDPTTGNTVRSSLRTRYRRLLLDEFQDTDPIQVELALLIASDGDRSWPELHPEPGRLFFVGDPKQSIYRFRRADIATFLTTQQKFEPGAVSLTRNFRTTAPIIDWVNHVFAKLITPAEGSQPAYQPLQADRDAAPVGPSVALLGVDAHGGGNTAADLRLAEADDVVAAITTAIADEWHVLDRGVWRPCTYSDITILLPARTSLPALERALERDRIPYRAETSSLVYATAEIRDLLAVLRAVNDPTDELSLVSALRTPYFGCGDDDLYTFHQGAGGSWDYLRPIPEQLSTKHPVAEAFAALAAFHDARLWLTPSELIERIVRDRRVLELGFTTSRPRDLLRRVRFVLDQARAYLDAQGGGLREFMHWVGLQSSDNARVAESILPESDDESVRIMTIHASKGLEFPVTILSGMSTAPQRRARGVHVVFPPGGRYGIRATPDLQTEAYERFEPIDEQLGYHEKIRLLYVAATRARDHLVVSLHRRERASVPEVAKMTMAELFEQCLDNPGAAKLEPRTPTLATSPPPPSSALPDRSTWEAERDRVLTTARTASTIAATTLARLAEEATDPGLQKAPQNIELPPWYKGRYGTAVGRAVHAVLQTADLASGNGVAEAAAAQAAAEGAVDGAEVIERLARSALVAPSVVAAVESTYWRELYVAAPLGSRLLEGYIDLLYRGPEGLVVVDYKTDFAEDDAARAAKVHRYRLQGASYAVAVEAAVNEPVARVVFLFLTETEPFEVELTDLEALTAEVRSSADSLVL